MCNNVEYNALIFVMTSTCVCKGSVSVYNLQLKSPNAIYHSTANTGKHTDPVWQVMVCAWCVHMCQFTTLYTHIV